MSSDASSLRNWKPAKVAAGRRWVQAWREAGQELERCGAGVTPPGWAARDRPALRAGGLWRPRGAAADVRLDRATAMVPESCQP